jgi:hypothetical protein
VVSVDGSCGGCPPSDEQGPALLDTDATAEALWSPPPLPVEIGPKLIGGVMFVT